MYGIVLMEVTGFVQHLMQVLLEGAFMMSVFMIIKCGYFADILLLELLMMSGIRIKINNCHFLINGLYLY